MTHTEKNYMGVDLGETPCEALFISEKPERVRCSKPANHPGHEHSNTSQGWAWTDDGYTWVNGEVGKMTGPVRAPENLPRCIEVYARGYRAGDNDGSGIVMTDSVVPEWFEVAQGWPRKYWDTPHAGIWERLDKPGMWGWHDGSDADEEEYPLGHLAHSRDDALRSIFDAWNIIVYEVREVSLPVRRRWNLPARA